MIFKLYMNLGLLQPTNCLLNLTIYNYDENNTAHSEIQKCLKYI